MAEMRVRIGIVDDHPVIITGTIALLQADQRLEVVSFAPTVELLLAAGNTLDIVLLDLQLSDSSSPEANIRLFTQKGIPVLAYTSGDRPSLIREAARAGAIGMIRKSAEPSEIIDAVYTANRGETVASADWAAAVDDDQRFVSAHLSDREAEVLALYATGETAERVGSLLHISRSTVIEHVKRIRERYAASGRPALTKHDLFTRAVEDGIVKPSFQVL